MSKAYELAETDPQRLSQILMKNVLYVKVDETHTSNDWSWHTALSTAKHNPPSVHMDPFEPNPLAERTSAHYAARVSMIPTGTP